MRTAAGVGGLEAHSEATGESKRTVNTQLLGFFEHHLFDLAVSRPGAAGLLPRGSRDAVVVTPATAALNPVAVPCCAALFIY